MSVRSLARLGPLANVRNIAITAPQASVVHMETGNDLQHKKEQTEEVSSEPTVRDFMISSHTGFVPRYSNSTRRSTATCRVSLTDDQLVRGEQVRQFLINNDLEGLWGVISSATRLKQSSSLGEILAREEITIMLKRLCDSQLQALKKVMLKRRAVTPTEFDFLKRAVDLKYNQISQVMNELCSHPSFEITGADVDMILQMLIENKDLNKASLWIKSMETHRFNMNSFKPTLNYQNYKLQILGGTTPLTWDLPHHSVMIQPSRRSKPIYTDTWANLLHNFPHNQYVPNLSTHKELISGFAKHGTLQQAKDYIQEIWGISEDGSSPEYILEPTSAIYPDGDLLERIIIIFSYHGQIQDVLPYLDSFDRYYKLGLEKHAGVWKALINQLRFADRQAEDKIATFRSVWQLIQHKKIKFSSGLYKLRLNTLRGSEFENELVGDIPLIWKRFGVQNTENGNKAAEKLMGEYLEIAVAVIYKNDIEADNSVAKLLSDYCFSETQLQRITLKSEKIKKRVLQEKLRFEQLQKQYDEEDEEDALW